MIEVTKILYEICEDERVLQSDFDLVESGVLDSFTFIELFSVLEDYGITLQPTRIDRNCFRTPKDIQKLVTMEMIRFIIENPDFILNNTSYGSDLSYVACCESLDGKQAMLCGLKRLARWEGDQLIDVDKCVLVFQTYGDEKAYKIIKVLFDLGRYRFTDSEDDYKKIMKEKQEKENRRLQRTHSLEKTITTLRYSDKLFDIFARKYYNTRGKQFKGKIINFKKKSYRKETYYFVDYLLDKKGKIDRIYVH